MFQVNRVCQRIIELQQKVIIKILNLRSFFSFWNDNIVIPHPKYSVAFLQCWRLRVENYDSKRTNNGDYENKKMKHC